MVTRDDINRIQATSVAGAVRDVPGVTTSENNNDPSQSINIRGLQDFGRVNVLVDGARQNFQTTGHSANGRFFLDPEFIGGIDITRGPVSTIYGSGAIGGVVLFRTTTIDDILAADERYGVSQKIGVVTNGPGFFTSTAAGARIGTAADVFGQFVYRDVGRYRDGSGVTVPDTDRELVGGLGKFNLRPADGHTLSFSGQRQRYDFVNNGGTGTGTRFRHDVDTGTYTIGHRFQRPDMPWLDFSAKGYVTTTTDEQTVAEPTATFASLGARPGVRAHLRHRDARLRHLQHRALRDRLRRPRPHGRHRRGRGRRQDDRSGRRLRHGLHAVGAAPPDRRLHPG